MHKKVFLFPCGWRSAYWNWEENKWKKQDFVQRMYKVENVEKLDSMGNNWSLGKEVLSWRWEQLKLPLNWCQWDTVIKYILFLKHCCPCGVAIRNPDQLYVRIGFRLFFSSYCLNCKLLEWDVKKEEI